MPPALVVSAIERRAERVLEFTLAAPDPSIRLPRWQPGASIRLQLPNGLSRSYSLIGELDGSAYRIAVALDPASRGGSRLLHESIAIGDLLRAESPTHAFRLVDVAPCVFIAGGIGITPFVSMIEQMTAQARPWRLLYAVRHRGDAAYLDRLEAWSQVAAGADGSLSTWFDDEQGGTSPDLPAYLEAVPPDWHLYACGPVTMLEAFLEATRGRPIAQVHLEYFRTEAVAGSDHGFVVDLARTGRRVQVPAGNSILDALMMEGIDAPYSCYEGLCGTCETRVLEGVPEHRDQLLTDKARASNQTVIICRSGSLTPRLVLDL